MTNNEYIAAIERMNAQTTKEWDAYLAKPANDEEACKLAEMQGTRSNRLEDRYKLSRFREQARYWAKRI